MGIERAGFKGRGAADNPQGRFEKLDRESETESLPEEQEEQAKPRTTITLRDARSIVSHNASPDVSFNQSINPYQGCEHGCIYCFARPTHSYLDLSPGLDFETRLFGKRNAAELLRNELSRPGYKCEVIALGVNTDAYQPVERDLKITRGILEVLHEFRHPVGLITKSALIERDIDLLAPMAAEGLVNVHFSVTTLDAQLARKLEPRAAAPFRRLEAIEKLSAAGIPCGVMIAPVIPFLNDRDLEKILDASAASGAQDAGYVLVRLPHEVSGLFKEWLERHYPLKAAHIMARIRDMRGGREYESTWGKRMRGEGGYADLIEKRFEIACQRLRLNRDEHAALDTTKFCVPQAQRSLF